MSKTFIESLVGKRVRDAGEREFATYGWQIVVCVEEEADGYLVSFSTGQSCGEYDVHGKQIDRTNSRFDLLVHPADEHDLGALTDEEVELIKQRREANKPPATRVVELYTDGEGKEFDTLVLGAFLFGNAACVGGAGWADEPCEGMHRKVRVTVEHLEYVEDGGE